MSSVLEPLQWYYEVPMEVYSLGFSSKHQLVIDMIRELIEKKKKVSIVNSGTTLLIHIAL